MVSRMQNEQLAAMTVADPDLHLDNEPDFKS